MSDEPLDNPIWSALITRHAQFGFGGPLTRRYDPALAPFVAVAEPSVEAEASLLSIVKPGEKVGLAGSMPPFSDQWEVEKDVQIFQMVFSGEPHVADSSEIKRLGDEDLPAMLELTALVYPAYFRAGTAKLGAYYGIHQDGRLAAMAGERMNLDGYVEISAVCTHPDFLGRGYASRLMDHLVSSISSRGDLPFLHVDDDNVRAIGVYERCGFTLRRRIAHMVVTRR